MEEDFIRLVIGFDVNSQPKRNGWLLPVIDDFMLQTIFGGGVESSTIEDLRSSQVDDQGAKKAADKQKKKPVFNFKKLMIMKKKDKLKGTDSPIKRLDQISLYLFH